ncbi:DEAD/DEAH box helicase [Stenotrophomonas maltophilia]|uniref:DEAD/DEAH box helicase n=1 Tax=Stenotrophomonas maltophilia TaxID=40324 RepID=UPI002B1E5DD6|nr:DEAD/DEAH box helicase [Stenotrophomonas maltophilia]
MQLALRDYQEDAIGRVRQAMRQHRKVLLVLPTGGGKTAIASHMAGETAARGQPVYFNCHRAELVEQTSRTWQKYGIRHGFIAAGRPKRCELANVCSIDTLKNRLMTTPEPRVVIWDECHHLGAAGWQAVMEAWPNAWHIGLTATPWRLDGAGMGRQFDVMVEGPTSAWLMEQGHLSEYELYAPEPPDMGGARTDKAGEYSKREASKRMDMPKRTGRIVEHWRRYADGMRTIAFAVNRADSMMIVDKFNAAGIPAAHLDGDTDDAERARVIADFAAGHILVLSNVALFGEGFDLSAIAQTDVTIDCLIDAAPTKSLSAVLQRWGRVLRPKPYAAVILDHAGNSNAHGFPDDEREWSLDDRERSGKGGGGAGGPPPPYTCKCFRQIKRPLPVYCPHCGVAIETEAAAPVKEGDEELQRRTNEEKAAERRQRRSEESAATTLPELVALAHRRGYPNPTAWAMRKFQASAWRKEIARRPAA